MPVDFDRPLAQRLMSFGVVAALHVLVVALLVSQSASLQRALPQMLRVVQILPRTTPPPPPPPLTPTLAPPDLAPMPVPEIELPQTASPSAPRAIVRVAPRAPAVSHFGPANDDMGLGVEAATSGAGGARGRGSLGEFQAAVKRAVLARKRQPQLAWDRRNTCVVEYTASVRRDGSLAGVRIEPCGVPEINAAAAQAVRDAAPFPAPPDLGGNITEIHGTLVFHP